MSWCWKTPWHHDIWFVWRICPPHTRMPLHAPENSESVIEIEQVCATSHQHMLTVVQHFSTARIDKTRRSSAKFFSRFQKHHPLARIHKSNRCRNTRESASDDCNRRLHDLRPMPRARSAIITLRSVGNETRLREICDGSRAIRSRSSR